MCDEHDASAEPVLTQCFYCRRPCCPCAQYHEYARVAGVRRRHLGRAGLGHPVRLGQLDPDVVAVNHYVEAGQGVECGGLEQVSGLNRETGVVPGADEPRTAQDALGQRRAVVGAVGVEGMHLSPQLHEEHLGVARRDLLHGAVGEFSFVSHKVS